MIKEDVKLYDSKNSKKSINCEFKNFGVVISTGKYFFIHRGVEDINMNLSLLVHSILANEYSLYFMRQGYDKLFKKIIIK